MKSDGALGQSKLFSNKRLAILFAAGWFSCGAVLILDRNFVPGTGALSAFLFYISLFVSLILSFYVCRRVYSSGDEQSSAPAVNAEEEINNVSGSTAGSVECQAKAEAAQKTSEHQLRQLVDAIPGLLVTAAADGEVEYINEPVQKITGRSLESIQRLGWTTMIHPEDVQNLMNVWRSAVETGTPMQPEYRQLCADGTYRWWQNRMEPFKDANGTVIRWYGVITDIDDRKKAEQALQESERQLRQMVDAIPVMLIINSPAGEVEYVNQPLVDLFGHDLELLRNFGWTSILHPEDAPALLERLKIVYATGEPLDTEYRMLCADGKYRWMECRKQPFRDADGRIIRWYGVLTNIDARKKAEMALRENEHQLRLIVETISALVWRATPDGWLDYVNQRGLDYTGKSLSDFAVSGWIDLIHPDDVEAALRKWRHSVETGKSFAALYRFRGADGTYRWFQVRAEPLLDGDGKVIYWYGMHIDVDESKRVEELLRNSQERLSRAMQIATVAETSASIAHEINQPLGALVVNGYACQGWLSSEPPNIERARVVLERIIRDGNAASEVVKKIRELFRQIIPTKISLNIREVIAEAHHLLLDEFKRKKISVNLELDENLPLVPADRLQVQQVLVNLMHNAVEAMECAGVCPKRLTVRAGCEGANLVVEVRDNGCGLPDGEKVFEPFFSTKQNGVGVGLAICRSIIEAHDGEFRAKNNEDGDGGAVFAFTLPAFSREVPDDSD